MLKKEANKITGGLSAPGKMPEGSITCRPAPVRLAPSSGRSQTRHAINVMPLKDDTIFQM